MTDQATTRLAEIRSRAEAFETASMDNGAGAAYDSAADVPFLLSLVEQLQGQLDKVREHQLGMARGFAHDAQAQRQRAGDYEWNVGHIATRAEGSAWGAVAVLQMLLMETGEVEYDEAAETTWDVVMTGTEGARTDA